MLVAEQTRDDRQQRDAPQDGVAGKSVTQVMQTYVLDPGSVALLLSCAPSTRAADLRTAAGPDLI